MIDCKITENYLKEKARMTNGCEEISCGECPLQEKYTLCKDGCDRFIDACPDKAIDIVQKWSDAHPLRTYLSDFLSKYPNAEFGNDGYPKVSPCILGYLPTKLNYCRYRTCEKCWNKPLENEGKPVIL